MSREARLQSAKHWLPTYRGRDVVKGYRKWYGVSAVCAILELRMLGIPIDERRLAQARSAEADLARHRAARRRHEPAADHGFGHDDPWEFELGERDGEGDDGDREPDPPS